MPRRGAPFRLRAAKLGYPWKTAVFASWATVALCLGGIAPLRGIPPPRIGPAPRPGDPSAGADSPYPNCVNQLIDRSPVCGGGQMVYDAHDGYPLVYMICIQPTSGLIYVSCTFAYIHGSWVPVATGGPSPPALLADAFLWDPADGYAMLFGGEIFPFGIPFQWVWTYSDGAWTNLTTAPHPGPHEFWFPAAAFDSTAGAVISTWTGPANLSDPSGPVDAVTYSYLGGVWTNLTRNLTAPTTLGVRPQASDDPSDRGVVYFGGLQGANASNSTLVFSGGNWSSVTSRNAPAPFPYRSMAYDPFDGAVLLVGGTVGFCAANPCALADDEWTFSSGNWTNISASVGGSRPLEWSGSMIADLGCGCMLEGFGAAGWTGTGINAYLTLQPYLFAYSNGSWTAIGVPPAAPFPTAWVLALSAALGSVAAAFFFVRKRSAPSSVPGPPETR